MKKKTKKNFAKQQDDIQAKKSAKQKAKKFKDEIIVKGKITGSAKGYAFLTTDNSEEDIFIPASATMGAVHGDEVMAGVGKYSNGKRAEGRVIEIIRHNLKTLVGQIQVFKGFAFVVPDNKKINKDIFVKIDKIKNATYGDKVVVNITKFNGKKLEGEVVEVLGPSNNNPLTDVLSIVRNYELIEEFPLVVESEAERVSQLSVEKNLAGRRDFRDTLCITIDGDDSKDFDDAVSLTMKNGNYVLGVHIADVGEYVKMGSEIDKEAYKRGTSVYFPNLVLPMLPQVISNGCCSLVENQDRLTLSCIMTIDKNGNVISHDICESVIKSKNRMTYKNVTKILQGDEELNQKYSHLVEMLKNMQELCLILEKRRHDQGSLDFDIPEPQVVVDPQSLEVIDLVKRPRTISERMIEMFMVLANETVAEHFQKLKIPFVYRIHESPDTEKIEAFNDFIKPLGLKIKDSDVNPKDLQNFLATLENNPMKDVVNKVLLRAMQKAKYSPDCLGHYGLALTYYCHFTSPIRRYPDLTIHRIIKKYLRGQLDERELQKLKRFVFDSSNQSSQTEVNAEKAEREVDDYFKARWMKDKIGEVYTGVISGVMSFGLFVELENTVEGFVPTETISGSGFVFNEKQLKLSNGLISYRLGDTVTVKVVGVDLTERRVNFAIV